MSVPTTTATCIGDNGKIETIEVQILPSNRRFNQRPKSPKEVLRDIEFLRAMLGRRPR